MKINGNGFSPNTTVSICSVSCPIINSTNTEIYCTVPAASSNANQDCAVTVSDNGVTDTEPFNYVASITPQVTSASPLRGGTGGGTRITIVGTNFP